MTDDLKPPRDFVEGIAYGLAAYRDHVAKNGECADGAACVWCPAEMIAERLWAHLIELGDDAA